MATYELKILGMTCGKCEKLIREAIFSEIPNGISEVTIDRPSNGATIVTDRTLYAQERSQIQAAINDLINGKFKAEFVDADVATAQLQVPTG